MDRSQSGGGFQRVALEESNAWITVDFHCIARLGWSLCVVCIGVRLPCIIVFSPPKFSKKIRIEKQIQKQIQK